MELLIERRSGFGMPPDSKWVPFAEGNLGAGIKSKTKSGWYITESFPTRASAIEASIEVREQVVRDKCSSLGLSEPWLRIVDKSTGVVIWTDLQLLEPTDTTLVGKKAETNGARA